MIQNFQHTHERTFYVVRKIVVYYWYLLQHYQLTIVLKARVLLCHRVV